MWMRGERKKESRYGWGKNRGWKEWGSRRYDVKGWCSDDDGRGQVCDRDEVTVVTMS